MEDELFAESFGETSEAPGAFLNDQFQFETLNKAKYSQGKCKVIDSHGMKQKSLVRYFEKHSEDEA